MWDGPEREMSERHAEEEEQLTFNPGRPISPWRRIYEGRGDAALVRPKTNTKTNTFVAKYIRDICQDLLKKNT